MKSIFRELDLGVLTSGPHLLTQTILRAMPEIQQVEVGLLNLFLPHTSASICLSENADPDVQTDLEDWLNRTVPHGEHYIHSAEGPDDMPAHIRSILFGSSVIIPIAAGKTRLGTWQGVYIYEHRERAPQRKLYLTLLVGSA